MIALATAENETWGNNATGQFKALFPGLLADTEAPPEIRLNILDELIGRNDPECMPIVVEALLEGANTNSFSRSVGAEIHGSRPALKPWQPKTWKEVWDYVIECLNRLAILAGRSDAIGQRARSGMGHEFRILAAPGLIDHAEKWVEQVTAANSYWPEALDSLGNALQYDADGMDKDVKDRVRALIAKLTPDTLESRVRFLVTEMPWDYPGDEKLGFDELNKRQVEAVEELVGDLLKSKEGPAPYFAQLSRGDQRMTSAFGRALAKQSDEPLAWRAAILAAVEEVPSNERNFSLLGGYMLGLNERNASAAEDFKIAAARSEVFAPALPLVCWLIGINESDIPLVRDALTTGLIPPFMMAQWQMGGVLAKVRPEAIAPLIDQMFRAGGRSYSIALDLLGMYVHGAAGRLEALRPLLRAAAEGVVGREKRPGSQMDAHHFKEVMKWLLNKGRDDADARAVAVVFAKQVANDPDGPGSDMIGPLLPKLFEDFSDIVWPIIGQAIVQDRKKAWRIEHAVGDRYSFGQEQRPAILQVPQDLLFSWCHAHPDVGPSFVASVAPVLTNRDPNAGEREFHPLVRRLLDEFGDREDVLQQLIANMHSFGWTGSRTTYYALYEQPLRSLEAHPIGAVRRWAKKMLSSFRREIDAARNEDEERDASWGL